VTKCEWNTGVLGLAATNEVLVELRLCMQTVASFDFWVFNVWPIVASLFVKGYKGAEARDAHGLETWQNTGGCWCMPLMRPRPLSQSLPLPISNKFWKTGMLAHQRRRGTQP